MRWARVTASVLVLGQRDDEVHPLEAAEAVAAAIPRRRLEVSDVPWIWGAAHGPARDRLGVPERVGALKARRLSP